VKTTHADVVVIGGGIAGAAAGYFLAESGADVVLVEAERQLAQHATGRSAALLIGSYGAEPVRPLTAASRGFLQRPPEGLVDAPLLSPRPVLTIASEDDVDRLTTDVATGQACGAEVELIRPADAAARVPWLRLGAVAAAAWETNTFDIDVAGLHQAFVRGLRRRGGTIICETPLEGARRSGSTWQVTAGSEAPSAPLLVNAAGAWGDEVAARAGVEPIGLEPRRRTIFMTPGRQEWSDWPLVLDAAHRFYVKPEGPQLLCSPADQTPVTPQDARPDELAIAAAIERINTATTLGIRSVRSSWAGLRTFAPDESMVIGPDPTAPGFVWLVGQGGTGIQTAPAAGQLVAALATSGTVPDALSAAGVQLDTILPDRFR
jgi:D-arginine dehydrogenase